MQPGSIVRYRDRDWILLPSEDGDYYRLRPLTGAIDGVILVNKILSKVLPIESIKPSSFPIPSVEDFSDANSAYLLWQAARLTLRDGATPFRSLGRISIRPRTYQFVPLLMALRLDPVRLFIADDVGVGKTIEALLIARELLDRGEISRMAVLAPPYLCDQWEKEMREKFNLEAVVIRSSTIRKLENNTPPGKTVFQHYPIQVISIDWVKNERVKHLFLQSVPELVIVDEAHGAANADPRNKSQQQRHKLLKEIAADEKRHLILLTATPHSGIEAAFKSLLVLIKPHFQTWELGNLDESKRAELARHFVQRTRKDIEQHWESSSFFPERISEDRTYVLSEDYRELFGRTYDFSFEIIKTGEGLEERKRRVRYWGALALLRSVMSSPAAAVAAIENRIKALEPEEVEVDFAPMILESTTDVTDDEVPIPPIEQTKKTVSDSDRRKLRELSKMALKLFGPRSDPKLAEVIETVRDLLKENYNPIIWCRYVATAEYVADELRKSLSNNIQVTCITGRLGEDERKLKIDEIDVNKPHILVATDCLSEGINLQEKFNAVIHYDLPWNPNKLEQREGRVDRYGQTSPKVKAVRLYGRDNPVDGAVINVLLDKAKEIHRTLGTYVPVPEDSESVMEAVLNSLFFKYKDQYAKGRQLTLFGDETLIKFHRKWDLDAQREKINRTRFAQRALKPEEVQRELESTDKVLGDANAVRDFVLNAAQRINLQIIPVSKKSDVFLVNVSQNALGNLPDEIKYVLPAKKDGYWKISFVSPTPEGAEYIGRNHKFVSALAQYLLEDALTNGKDAIASRCGVIRTSSVRILTTLLLLRVRYLIEIPQKPPLLSEEVLVTGYRDPTFEENPWLSRDEALRLLADAKPIENIPPGEKRELIELMLEEISPWNFDEWNEESAVRQAILVKIHERAKELEESHKRIRKAVSLRIRELKVTPKLPPDLLGILVLQPSVRRK